MKKRPFLKTISTIFQPGTTYLSDKNADIAEFNAQKADERLLQQLKHDKEKQSTLLEFQRKIHSENLEEHIKNRDLQAEMSYLNRESSKYQARMNRELQREITNLNHTFSANENSKNRQNAIKLNELRQKFEEWKFNEQRNLQFELKELDAQISKKLRLIEAKLSREKAKQLIIDKELPLNFFVSEIISNADKEEYLNLPPLYIFSAPYKLEHDNASSTSKKYLPPIEVGLSTALLKLQKFYASDNRHIKFYSKAWKSKKNGGETGIQKVFNEFSQNQINASVLILESFEERNLITIKSGYWTVNSSDFKYDILLELDWRKLLRSISRETTLNWKNIKFINKNDSEVKTLLSDEQYNRYKDNLNLLDLEPKDRNNNDILSYKQLKDDSDVLAEYLISFHVLYVALYADQYFLMQFSPSKRKFPFLPTLINNWKDKLKLKQEVIDIFLPIAVKYYNKMILQLESQESKWGPELRLEMAESLSVLPDKSYAKEFVIKSIEAKLNLNKQIK